MNKFILLSVNEALAFHVSMWKSESSQKSHNAKYNTLYVNNYSHVLSFLGAINFGNLATSKKLNI